VVRDRRLWWNPLHCWIMFRRTGVARLSCRHGGVHVVRTKRMWITVARLGDLPSMCGLLDDVARYWQGVEEQLTVVLPGTGPTGERVDGPAIPRLVATGCNPLFWHVNCMTFVARARGTGELIADISLYPGSGRCYQIGGNVGRHHRGQGYGREMLTMVCRIAHRHLGIADLIAGCETTNEASRRWLASCGFWPAEGPPQHVLPNGRVIESCWWRKSAPAALRCRNSPSTEQVPADPQTETTAS
jgi:Acetyltransferase (GNAT) domain